ncbi:phosphoglycerate mutase-like protein [Aspergillus avenaceus]|uniref:3-phytase n=1 Tax=Aspergillus avenaceus TaxID=36643 RepID=A0A5N6TDC3_ASPAV|nr:phosphoglycerate mutase-like protein [Aspergillus avenaceus]
MNSTDQSRIIYPEQLSLQSVHIVRIVSISTTSFNRFVLNVMGPIPDSSCHVIQETGIPAYWPLCTAAKAFTTTILQPGGDLAYTTQQWKRALETIRADDGPSIPNTSMRLCNHGELTDQGRRQMVSLGKQLRQLYVDQLKLLPPLLTDARTVSFRSSPYLRALDSLQHVVWGLFPPSARSASFGLPLIVMRSPEDETLLPNEDFCKRFIEMSKAYARRTADQWNESSEMTYLNSLLRKYMPSQKLPDEFYSSKVADIIDKIAYEEEFGAYHESREMRRVGIGALLGDVTERLVAHANHSATTGDTNQKLFLAGSHDSTLGAIMASLGVVDVEAKRKWPPYASALAIELFSDPEGEDMNPLDSTSTPRASYSQLSAEQKTRLKRYYVRMCYNGQALVVPGCRRPGHNWNGNASFCSLATFKQVVDDFTPRNWKQTCKENLGEASFPRVAEPAGYW